jgi:cyclin-like protein
MATPDYMDAQDEITWAMRQTLVDWLLQVHLRYHMLPETLWIAVNIVDRFLSQRTVSLVKLQLVGVIAMFIASKYEEILAPSVDEFVFMTENGYSKEEILKGEWIVLQTLEFNISHYCSPYSWMRKISHADDYDIQTRTLSKFLAEVSLLDHRFLRVKPSMIAAIGMYTARRMLGGDWVSIPFLEITWVLTWQTERRIRFLFWLHRRAIRTWISYALEQDCGARLRQVVPVQEVCTQEVPQGSCVCPREGSGASRSGRRHGPSMIHACTRYPKCYQSHTLISCMHLIFKAQTHLSRFTPCRFLQFSRLVKLSSPLCSPPSCVNTLQSTHHIMHPMQSPLPHHLTLALFAAFGSSLHGLFCICMSPCCIAFRVPRHLCSLALWFASEVSLCRHRICLVLQALICFCDKPSPLLSTFLPSLEAHTAGHTRDNCDDYLCVSPI